MKLPNGREIKPKSVTVNQQYDNYWKLTVEYTDIFSRPFNQTLRLILDFIDENKETEYSAEKYKRLQKKVYDVFNKADLASVRKSINQFIKLGFVKPKLCGYDDRSRKFLTERDPEKKKSIFSVIFYENASFSSSVTNNFTERNEVKFLLQTLAYHPNKELTKDDVIGLMVTPEIEKIAKGRLTDVELNEQNKFAKMIKFDEKKYNQISYLFIFLNYMPNINADAKNGIKAIEKEPLGQAISAKRDPIRYAIFRSDLKHESISIFGKELCYVDMKWYKSLITSHIKDSAVCIKSGDIDDAYDYQNGLLLSSNVDAFFDKYDITIDEKGCVVVNEEIFKDNKEYGDYLSTIKLDQRLMTERRNEFLVWHRKKFLEKRSGSELVDYKKVDQEELLVAE